MIPHVCNGCAFLDSWVDRKGIRAFDCRARRRPEECEDADGLREQEEQESEVASG